MNCGIYKITNIVTGDYYIGSAINLSRRLKEHRCRLVGNSHHNIHLQRSWNKYGEEKFTFETLELCEKEQAIEREQFYIDSLKPEYNILPTAGSHLGAKRSEESKRNMSEAHKGKALTDETKKRMSESHTGERNYLLGKHLSSETKCKLSEAHTGKHLTEEHKQKLSESHKGRTGGMLGKHHSEESRCKLSESIRRCWEIKHSMGIEAL